MSVLLARRRTAVSNSNAITGTLIGPTTITTSTQSTATAYSNQRKIDRCQNGVLWMMFTDAVSLRSDNLQLAYSTDDGATWTESSPIDFFASGNSYTPNVSLFIDVDDYAHVVYRDRHNGYIYYRRGTPNAGRTAWTWSAALVVFNLATNFNYPDIVAHREGTGWMAHIVMSQDGNAADAWHYQRVSITSGGTIALSGSRLDNAKPAANAIAGYPSIDFNHTGDGKTVAGGTPHLYVAWSAGQAGSGYGIRFKKATYSGGTWTWGTEREIDSGRYISTASNHWLNCLFDGTRVVIVGSVYDSGSFTDVVLHDRDAADTTTTTRTLLDNSTDLLGGSASYDGAGNVYLFGRDFSGSAGSRVLGYRKWTRATTTLDSKVTVDSSGNDTPYVSAKRGYSQGRIEFVYTDGTSSPYNVVYGGID